MCAAESKSGWPWGPSCHGVQTFACLLAAALLGGTVCLPVLVTGRWVGCQAAPAGGAVSFRPIPSSLPLVGKLPPQRCHLFLDHLGAPRAATLCLLEFTSSSRSSSNFSCSSTGRCFWFSSRTSRSSSAAGGWEQGMRGQSQGSPLGPVNLGRQPESHSSPLRFSPGAAVKQ